MPTQTRQHDTTTTGKGHPMVSSTYLSTGDANDGGEGDIAAVLRVLKALIHRFFILAAADVDDDDDLRLEESP